MKIPRSIRVYGHKWDIKYKWNLRDDNGEAVDGMCDNKERAIYIDRSSDKEERLGIFFHELFHVIIHELKVGQTELNPEVEEIIVEGISDYLVRNFNIRRKNGGKR